MSYHQKPDKFIDEYRSRQRNIVFPDTVRNARFTYAFFWKGSPRPLLVQKIAAWICGLVLIGYGLESLSLDVKARVEDGFSIGIVISAAIAVSLVLIGIRVFCNGFARHAKPDLKVSK
jgi:hypothetical protein